MIRFKCTIYVPQRVCKGFEVILFEFESIRRILLLLLVLVNYSAIFEAIIIYFILSLSITFHCFGYWIWSFTWYTCCWIRSLNGFDHCKPLLLIRDVNVGNYTYNLNTQLNTLCYLVLTGMSVISDKQMYTLNGAR